MYSYLSINLWLLVNHGLSASRGIGRPSAEQVEYKLSIGNISVFKNIPSRKILYIWETLMYGLKGKVATWSSLYYLMGKQGLFLRDQGEKKGCVTTVLFLMLGCFASLAIQVARLIYFQKQSPPPCLIILPLMYFFDLESFEGFSGFFDLINFSK